MQHRSLSASHPNLHLTFFNTTSSVRPDFERYKSKESSYASSKQNTEGRGDVWLGHETTARDVLAEASATDAGELPHIHTETLELCQSQTGSMLMAGFQNKMPCICSDSASLGAKAGQFL